ncbi:MAG TPA: SUMF1/EgtB/PvdO family nonheme iron enzyme, partial [Candidatus Acidoferrales bacterium]|nr:SUMF1/EgtB/PvdO family nonheme iron enzyme [Candidatus Acidoferrales bacterium]
MSSPTTATVSLQPLLHRVQEARKQTDALFTFLTPEALYERSIAERHRLIFYLGHLEAFDWNLLSGALHLETKDAGFDKLFSFGIDPTQGNLPSDQPADWPAESQVREYGQTIRRRLDDALASPVENTQLPPLVANGTFLHVAIEHRLMHAETLAYLLHQLPNHKKRGPALPLAILAPAPEPEMAAIPPGTATLGQPSRGASRPAPTTKGETFAFGWDNEFETHVENVPEFRIGVYPVTNAQFLEFVRAGGYSDPGLWSSEDWAWKESRGLRHPHFWQSAADRWFLRGMFELHPLPLDWPVYVSHAEATAYS